VIERERERDSRSPRCWNLRTDSSVPPEFLNNCQDLIVFMSIIITMGDRGSTVLQIGRSLVRSQLMSVDFSLT